jgi:hypothetical protein
VCVCVCVCVCTRACARAHARVSVKGLFSHFLAEDLPHVIIREPITDGEGGA